MQALFTADDLYKIDLTSGDVEALIANPAILFDAANIAIRGNKLFFINRLDRKLYTISLNK